MGKRWISGKYFLNAVSMELNAMIMNWRNLAYYYECLPLIVLHAVI